MTVKDELRPLLLPLVVAESDALAEANINYRWWEHSYYPILAKRKADPDQEIVYTAKQLEIIAGAWYLNAKNIQDQAATWMVVMHQVFRILYDNGLVDKMPELPTCMVGADGFVRIGGSCTGGGGGW